MLSAELMLTTVFYFLIVYLKPQYTTGNLCCPTVGVIAICFGVLTLVYIKNIGVSFFLPLMIASLLAYTTTYTLQRKRAGKLLLPYRINYSSKINVFLLGGLIVFMGYLFSIPNQRTYPGGEPVYDDKYYSERLPVSIIVCILGFVSIPVSFRKGEIFENGLATPRFEFYPWNNYTAYKWIENTRQKIDQPLTLFLQGERGISHTVYGFSESTKSILDEVLSTRLKKLPETENPKQAGQDTTTS